MRDDRPDFRHEPGRHGLVGPFTRRQLAVTLIVIAGVAIGLVVSTVRRRRASSIWTSRRKSRAATTSA